MGTKLFDACSSNDDVDVLRPLIDEARENAAVLNCKKYNVWCVCVFINSFY